jgi:hypothetical protein
MIPGNSEQRRRRFLLRVLRFDQVVAFGARAEVSQAHGRSRTTEHALNRAIQAHPLAAPAVPQPQALPDGGCGFSLRRDCLVAENGVIDKLRAN